MKRELDACQLAERSVSKKYRKEIWNPFIAAVKRYELIAPGDKIAVCVSGGKDSFLCAALMRMLQRFSEVLQEWRLITEYPQVRKIRSIHTKLRCGTSPICTAAHQPKRL